MLASRSQRFLQDNIRDPDGFRFHDVFHFAHAAVLHWSPTFRSLIKRKRKSAPKVAEDAPARRARTLLELLNRAARTEIDSLWIGRDLGYRSGRRTGLALTDDVHLSAHTSRWDVSTKRATAGAMMAERTAAVIWKVLATVSVPVFLWNAFPYHPHETDRPFTNRTHTVRERMVGEELLADLISL